MMPADLIYALSTDQQRAELNRARASRTATADARRRHHRARRDTP